MTAVRARRMGIGSRSKIILCNQLFLANSCGESKRFLTNKLNGKVFGNEVPIFEQHYNVHFKFNFKCSSREGGARKEAWKDHVNRNLEVSTYISVSNLNVLNFSSFKNG